jgi:hypothetical protein
LLEPNADELDVPSHDPEYENRGDESEMNRLVDMGTTCPGRHRGLTRDIHWDGVDIVQVGHS